MARRTRARLTLFFPLAILLCQTPPLRISRTRLILNRTVLHARSHLLKSRTFRRGGGIWRACCGGRLRSGVGGDIGFQGSDFGFGEQTLFFEPAFAAAFVAVPEYEEEDWVRTSGSDFEGVWVR